VLTPLASLPSGHHSMNECDRARTWQHYKLAGYKEILDDKPKRNSVALGIGPTDEISQFEEKGDCYDKPKRNSVAVTSNRLNHLDQKSMTSRTRYGETNMQTEIEILETRENPSVLWL